MVTSVSWSPDGSQIAFGSDDKTVRVWDSSTGAVLSTLEEHSGGVTSVSWSHGGGQDRFRVF
jgi:WD40 repeat protein